MKKTLLVLFLAVSVSFLTFAREPVSTISEGWFRFGVEFGNFFERGFYGGEMDRGYIGSPGINFSSYRFTNHRNVGFFSSFFFGIPRINPDTNNFRGFDNTTQLGFIFGVGFRRELSERFTLHYGVGLNTIISLFDFTEHIPSIGNVEFEVSTITLGIGSDVGFKLRLSNTTFFSFGSIFTYDFARFWSTDTIIGPIRMNDSGWDEIFRGISIRPYFTIGFYLLRETIRF